MSASLANLGIEKAVLGSLINGGRSLIDVLGVAAIDPNLFHHSQSLEILGAIAELYEEGAPYDLQVVTERLRQHGTLGDVGGAAEITSLGIDGNPAPEVVRFNLGMLRDLEVKRRIARVGERMQRGQIEIEEACETLNEIRTRTYDHAKPLIEFRSPLELKNFTPPLGLVP